MTPGEGPDLDRAAAEQEQARAGLRNYLLWLEKEARQVRLALDILAGLPMHKPRQPRRTGSANPGTYELLRRYRDENFPPGGGPIEKTGAYRFLMDSGEWSTTAIEPLKAVQTSLAHMAEPRRGELEHTETRGEYRRPRGGPAS